MSVICRLRCSHVGPSIYEGGSARVVLTAVHSPDDVEDDKTLEEIRSFFNATPNALLDMSINNDTAVEQFQPGDEFYVELKKIPTDQTVQAIYSRRAAKAKTSDGA
jgi:hypothetical protein